MPVPPLKGVVFDVDGTLLTSDHRVSKHMQATCRALVDKGVWLSIASARPPGSVRLIGEAIGATGPLCALNGAIILGQDGVIQQRISLPQRTALELIARFTHDSRVSLNLYSGTKWIVPRLDSRICDEASIIGFEPTMGLNEVRDVEKILLMTDERLATSLTHVLTMEHDDIVAARSNPGYVEITPSGVDKARGVEEAVHRAGLSMAEIVACGDGENDVTLLERAGYGIAMGHSGQRLRGVARQIVGSNDDNSLPMALNKLFAIVPGSCAGPAAQDRAR
jgi:Cof subfamily protein (haloacid dehalogenase superfamily)